MTVPKPIHPFPARMAASIPWNILEKRRAARPLRVLDPMAGSGTTLVVARNLGHQSFGFDSDPLAVLIARAWCSDVDVPKLIGLANRITIRAIDDWRSVKQADAYPEGADPETRKFIRYWYDVRSRQQLAALARLIADVRPRAARELLWCAFSRLIIVKQGGASLAMDVSHSRPHKKYEKALIEPVLAFEKAVRRVLNASPFQNAASNEGRPDAQVRIGDARNLPLDSGSIDMVITSPPYLNAIDYLRGHKLSLVWMRHAIGTLRDVRSGNIGAEAGARQAPITVPAHQQAFDLALSGGILPRAQAQMFVRYLRDMEAVLLEVRRVMTDKAEAVFVVGDCNVRGIFVKNSAAIKSLAQNSGLAFVSERTRSLPANRRYLPPPQAEDAGHDLARRMRKEVVLKFAAG
jgi:DNA modification methylase